VEYIYIYTILSHDQGREREREKKYYEHTETSKCFHCFTFIISLQSSLTHVEKVLEKAPIQQCIWQSMHYKPLHRMDPVWYTDMLITDPSYACFAIHFR